MSEKYRIAVIGDMSVCLSTESGVPLMKSGSLTSVHYFSNT